MAIVATSQGAPRETEGGRSQTVSDDPDTQQLLTEILKELRILTLHMMVLTDNTFKKTEVEV